MTAALLAIADAAFAADEDALTMLFTVVHDGRSVIAVNAYRSTRECPLWPHDCGRRTDRCVRCAPDAVPVLSPDLLDGEPVLARVPAHREAPYAIASRYGHGDDRVDLVAPRHPRDRFNDGTVGWQLARVTDRSVTLRMTGWDPNATFDTLAALVREFAAEGRSVLLSPSSYFEPTDGDLAFVDAVANEHARDRTGPGGSIRRAHMVELAERATELFAHAGWASVMFAVGQYYSDQGNDQVHGRLYLSEQTVPMWPHPDGRSARSYLEPEYTTAPVGFGAFCVEGASQDQDERFSFRPFAIARRAPSGTTIEIVGRCRRTETVIGTFGEPPAPWPDARATALWELVCDSPDDDHAVQVFADHLMERGDPRGELVARRALGMLDPLGRVLVPEGARFSRGFLAHVDVYCPDEEAADAVRGAIAWGTVETLRYLPGSLGILDPAMRALREVGALSARRDLDAIASRTWAIASLQLALAPGDGPRWAALATLPALRHLAVAGELTEVAALRDAPWWPQLARVTLLSRDHDDQPPLELARDLAARGTPAIAWSILDELDRPAGWSVTWFPAEDRAEVTLAHWYPTATLDTLPDHVGIARSLAGRVDVVASPCFVPPHPISG